MKNWWKRIRAAVGMGLTWAVGWIGVLTIAVSIIEFTSGSWPPTLIHLLANAGLFGAMGFIGGAAFSGVLRLAEGRRTFDQMSLPRFASWGGVAGFLLYAFMSLTSGGLSVDTLIGGAFCALLGAGSSSGSLALARRADDRDLLEAGVDVGDIGLTEEEKVELLGS